MKFINKLYTSSFEQLRRPKISNKAWISPKELFKYTYWALWLFNLQELSKEVRTLTKRIFTLWSKSGSNFTFLYLKECNRLLIRYLADQAETIIPSSGIRVKRDKLGIPRIIPGELRARIVSKEQLIIRLVITIISVYKVMPTRAKVKVNTITDAFVGDFKTFDCSRAIKDMRLKLYDNRKMKWNKIESASPGAVKATWGSAADIIAFWYNPLHALYLIKMYWMNRGYIHILWFTFLFIISAPFALLSVLLKEVHPLGRLSVVLDKAGKARVVALCNYFIQIGLYPLHKEIFDFLRTLKTDGTFDQEAPLKLLISKDSDQKYFCFDLSAATDRLPVDLQVDILNHIHGLGDLWRTLLNIDWYFVHSSRGKKLPNGKRQIRQHAYWNRYAVGQPMGAYSSWAMLALTHHIIVKESALRAGIEGFEDYAILGDDIVIRNDKVAQEYLNLMKSLGVSINLGKSVISLEFAEFASRWIGNRVNFTPIGAGLILRTVRDKAYLGALLAEAFKTRLFANYGACLKILQKLPSSYRSQAFVGIWSCIGLKGAFWKIVPRDISYIKKSISWCLQSVASESIMVRFSLYNALYALRGEMYHDAIEKFCREIVYFNKNWNQLTAREWSGRFFEATTRLLSPGYWIYFIEYINTFWEILNDIIKWNFMEEINYNDSSLVSWDNIVKLADTPALDVSSIDWTNKKAISASSVLAKKLRAYAMLIRAKSMDGSLGESNSLLLIPSIVDIISKEDLRRVHKDLRPLVRFDKPSKRDRILLIK
nr:MAG: putative RNA dependent RNA polymerase [Zhejiang mito-like virus 8]